MGSRDEGSGKAKLYNSNLYLNMKNYEASLYTFITSMKYQIGYFLDCVDVYGNVIVIIIAFTECLLC